MYKDPEKQRKAVREATRRYRARLKGITPVSLNDGITQDSDTQDVIPYKRTESGMACGIDMTMEEQSYNPMMVGYVPPKE